MWPLLDLLAVFAAKGATRAPAETPVPKEPKRPSPRETVRLPRIEILDEAEARRRGVAIATAIHSANRRGGQ